MVIRDTTPMAINVGAGIALYGNYVDSTATIGGTIKLYKTNGTSNNWGFDIGIATRLHGSGNVTEVIRLFGDGNVSIGSTVSTVKLAVSGVISSSLGTASLPSKTFCWRFGYWFFGQLEQILLI